MFESPIQILDVKHSSIFTKILFKKNRQKIYILSTLMCTNIISALQTDGEKQTINVSHLPMKLKIIIHYTHKDIRKFKHSKLKKSLRNHVE